MQAAPDWMENNFKHKVLKHVQKQYDERNIDDQYEFFEIIQEKNYKKEVTKIVVKYDNQIIHKISYR